MERYYIHSSGDLTMKRIITLMITITFLLSLTTASVWAEGGKDRGDTGVGSTNQEGADSQGNQAP